MSSLLAHIAKTLERYYHEFPLEAQRHPELAQQSERREDLISRKNSVGHITTSITVLTPDTRRVLLIFHKVFNLWLPPGGHIESDHTLWDSGVREVREETGLSRIDLHPWTATHHIPIDIDTHPIAANAAKGEHAHLHHDFRFLGTSRDDEPLVPQLAEVSQVAWMPTTELRDSPDARVREFFRKLRQLNLV